jgi:diaminohydroxyphosphoribosylaminopyrimidine deaminase/5-amino-6-(5-phosphoribosylamino)uracil reductase
LKPAITEIDLKFMRAALQLARRGYGTTSPNPMVGAVLVKGGQVIGRGWHRRAGEPHAEIEALRDAARHGPSALSATLYVTLEPCSTYGRTPPCTKAIIDAGIRCVVIGAQDPNPQHAGKGFEILRRAGLEVKRLDVGDETKSIKAPLLKRQQKLASDCARLNEVFNHWIVRRTPFVTVKAAMTLDGRIATASGESKWITGERARAEGMKLRRSHDAILVGVNTVLADNPSLTVRTAPGVSANPPHILRRIVLDAQARTPVTAKVISDDAASLTTIVVSKDAPAKRVAALAKKVRVLAAPLAKKVSGDKKPRLDLPWLLKTLGGENVTSLLVEGGGEVNASFLLGGLAQRVAFFYAPKILGGRDAHKAVAGEGIDRLEDVLNLREVAWRCVGEDLMLTARVK